MTSNLESLAASRSRACFLVGVTGYMELTEQQTETLTGQLQRLFHFLRNGAKDESSPNLVEDLLNELVPDAKNSELRQTYRSALECWTGLGSDTPIFVLCNLAPGVDTEVANFVLGGHAGDKVHLLCPLPFPAHIYCTASTFVRFKEDGTPLPGNLERQQGFLRVLANMGAIEKEFVEQANGTKDLPDELTAALQKVSPEAIFPVQLRDDRSLDEKAMEEKWIADRDDKSQRHQRYYAAGEYLTVTSHLLVAVFNGQRDDSSTGTSAVVEARLSGPQRGLLASTSAVALQHGGPVWHLLADRPDSIDPEIASCAKTRTMDQPLPSLRILHPFRGTARDCPQAKIITAGQSKNVELQTDRLRLFARIGESLRNFNSCTVPAGKDPAQEFQRMLGEPSGAEGEFATLLKSVNERTYDRLRKTSDMRCRSSELTSFFQARVKRTLGCLFLITFVAAVSLHFLTHWHPQGHTVTVPAHLDGVQIGAGWLAMILTLVAICYFGWQRSQKLEAHWHDARAIAEGIRVQFYWNLAGLGKSVSANYLSRHRSELDWIRGVIRSTAFPYPIWADWFKGLDADLKLRAFRIVHARWVQHQLNYFRNSGYREHHELHLWHKLGAVLALAGVLTFLKLVSHDSGETLSHLFEVACHGWVAAVLLAAAASVSWYLASRTAVRSAAAGHATNPAIFPALKKQFEEARKRAEQQWNPSEWERFGYRPVRAMAWLVAWLRSTGGIGMEVVNILVPSHRDSAVTQTTFNRRLIHGMLSFLAHVPLSLAIACAAVSLCQWIADWSKALPDGMTLILMAAGMLLLAGALSVAWAEKNLHSELAYQYNTMAILFEAADDRLDKELTGFQNVITGGDEDAQLESMQRIHALLYELGQEALDENAEWLLLHRARPLEPVMAG